MLPEIGSFWADPFLGKSIVADAPLKLNLSEYSVVFNFSATAAGELLSSCWSV
jgi:hypothetical protein